MATKEQRSVTIHDVFVNELWNVTTQEYLENNIGPFKLIPNPFERLSVRKRQMFSRDRSCLGTDKICLLCSLILMFSGSLTFVVCYIFTNKS